MKHFIIKTFITLLIPLIGGLSVVFSLSYIASKSVDYKLKPGTTKIFIGDSHVQLAINDTLLKNSVNVATSSESYLFSYYKLKRLLEINPEINEVYLGYGYHNVSSYYDDFTSGKNSSSVTPKYFHSLPVYEQAKLIFWSIDKIPNLVRTFLQINYRYILKNEPWPGGHRNKFSATQAADSSMDKRINSQFYSNDTAIGFSKINQQYLTKTIALCETHHVKLVLLNVPIHPYYKDKIPTKFIDQYNKISKSVEVITLDLSEMPLNENSYIPDGDHLSMEGAATFTALFLDTKKQN